MYLLCPPPPLLVSLLCSSMHAAAAVPLSHFICRPFLSLPPLSSPRKLLNDSPPSCACVPSGHPVCPSRASCAVACLSFNGHAAFSLACAALHAELLALAFSHRAALPPFSILSVPLLSVPRLVATCVLQCGDGSSVALLFTRSQLCAINLTFGLAHRQPSTQAHTDALVLTQSLAVCNSWMVAMTRVQLSFPCAHSSSHCCSTSNFSACQRQPTHAVGASVACALVETFIHTAAESDCELLLIVEYVSRDRRDRPLSWLQDPLRAQRNFARAEICLNVATAAAVCCANTIAN